MGNIHLWVNLKNFELFLKGKPFIAWHSESSQESIQISIPKQRVKTFFNHEGTEGIEFNCI